MCGIVGYIGENKATPILIEGLKRLEYRGYDSAGISVINENGGVKTVKKIGRIENLEKNIAQDNEIDGFCGIAHTRWATHGIVNELNAHPHFDCAKIFFSS